MCYDPRAQSIWVLHGSRHELTDRPVSSLAGRAPVCELTATSCERTGRPVCSQTLSDVTVSSLAVGAAAQELTFQRTAWRIASGSPLRSAARRIREQLSTEQRSSACTCSLQMSAAAAAAAAAVGVPVPAPAGEVVAPDPRGSPHALAAPCAILRLSTPLRALCALWAICSVCDYRKSIGYTVQQ